MKADLEKLNKILGQGAVEAAPLLLGWVIERRFSGGMVRLKIIETEAYRQDDPASHSFRGQTPRTVPMFKDSGVLYVYFTYGMYYCLNFVAGKAGFGQAVLIRAAEPLEGLDIIRSHRQGVKDGKQLTNGPGKLCQALGIRSTGFSGLAFGPKTITVRPPGIPIDTGDIAVSPRIGIKQAADTPWRFYVKANPYVSGFKLSAGKLYTKTVIGKGK